MITDNSNNLIINQQKYIPFYKNTVVQTSSDNIQSINLLGMPRGKVPITHNRILNVIPSLSPY